MISRLISIVIALGAFSASANSDDLRVESRPATLVSGFVEALDQIATGDYSLVREPSVQVWIDGLRAKQVDPRFVAKRLEMARSRFLRSDSDFFEPYMAIDVEVNESMVVPVEASFPAALHAYRLDVVEDYDDWSNDDVYAYFITTQDDLLWGKVTSVYTGLDAGESVFFNPDDRGIFGPRGEKIVVKNQTIIDFGLIESESKDVSELQKVSDTIVDLAIVALAVNNPGAGIAAAQARAEVKNLLRMLVAMNDDDRIVTDTLRIQPTNIDAMLANDDVAEFERLYEGKRNWSKYAWRLHFRLIK